MTHTSRLFSILASITLLVAAVDLAQAQEEATENLQTRLVVRQGQDVFIRLHYSGGVEGWDAAFGYHGKIVTALNSAYITILDPNGNIATPRKGKLISSWVNRPMKEPFDIVINLAEVYDMSIPGRYIIEWGSKNVRSQSIQIDVIRGIYSNDEASPAPLSQEDTHLVPEPTLPKFN